MPALTIVLELLPLGAVCIFATSPTERVKETFSYFSLTPFGYANFAPLITATLTVAIFLLSLFSLKKNGILKALFNLSIITVVISLLPLMYGLNYYTLVGAFITVTLVIESIGWCRGFRFTAIISSFVFSYVKCTQIISPSTFSDGFVNEPVHST